MIDLDQASQEQIAEPNAEAIGGGQTAATDAEVQPEGQTGNIGPENLPPELEETKKELLRDYHKKTQELAADRRKLDSEMERLKQDSSTLQELVLQDWFKKAVQQEKQHRNGQSLELNDDEFARLSTDKKVFTDAVQKVAESLVESKYGHLLSNTNQELQSLKQDKELNKVAKEFKDFDFLNEKGFLTPYIEKGYDYRSAYALYKLDHESKHSEQQIQQEANKLLAAKRAASVEKPGVTRVNGQRVFKAKNLGDAFDKIFEAVSKGDENFVVEKE